MKEFLKLFVFEQDGFNGLIQNDPEIGLGGTIIVLAKNEEQAFEIVRSKGFGKWFSEIVEGKKRAFDLYPNVFWNSFPNLKIAYRHVCENYVDCLELNHEIYVHDFYDFKKVRFVRTKPFTVGELIEELSKIPNKDIPIHFFYNEYTGYPIVDIEVRTREECESPFVFEDELPDNWEEIKNDISSVTMVPYVNLDD